MNKIPDALMSLFSGSLYGTKRLVPRRNYRSKAIRNPERYSAAIAKRERKLARAVELRARQAPVKIVHLIPAKDAAPMCGQYPFKHEDVSVDPRNCTCAVCKDWVDTSP